MKTQLHVDLAQNKSVTVYSEDDVEEILEHNKTLRSMPQKSDWGRHIASIPNIILVKWLHESWQRGNIGLRAYSKEFDELVKKKLADPEWRYLRTDK